MNTPQTAILPEPGPAGLFLVLEIGGEEEAARAAARQCAGLEELASEVAENPGDAPLRTSVAFGSGFWARLSPGSRPALLRPFAPLWGRHAAPATGGDLFLHVTSSRPDLGFELVHRFLAGLGGSARVLEEVHGFRYFDSRDLTGFIDGTENPEGEERAEVALVGDEDPDFAGGSYVLTQRYVHDLEKWEQVPVAEQERVIGRTKPDSLELDDAVKPPTAHISRVVIEEGGGELEILRHSMPYGIVSGEKGLFFLAYGRDSSVFEKMLARMFGVPGGPVEDDGLSDRLLDFTTAVSGAFFFAPSRELLQTLGA